MRKALFASAVTILVLPGLVDGVAYDFIGLNGLCPTLGPSQKWWPSCSVQAVGPLNGPALVETLLVILTVALLAGPAIHWAHRKLPGVSFSHLYSQTLLLLGVVLSYARRASKTIASPKVRDGDA